MSAEERAQSPNFYSPLLNYLFTGHNIVQQKGSTTPWYFQVQTWRGYFLTLGRPNFKVGHFFADFKVRY
jgi:hypothetical protein